MRRRIVMADDLGLIGGAVAGLRFKPAGDRRVLLEPGSARQLLVRDVARERVPEGELALVRHRGPSHGADELTRQQLLERRVRAVV